jgi:hypothetical protein
MCFSMEQAIGYGKLGRFHNLYPPLLSVGVQWAHANPDLISYEAQHIYAHCN